MSGTHTSSQQAQDGAVVSEPDLPDICRNALQSGDPAALNELQKYARQILKLMGDAKIQKGLTVQPSDNVPVERIEKVYQILAEVEPSPEVSPTAREAFIQENITEELEIGRVFRENLLRDLDSSLTDLVVFFARVPSVSKSEQRHLAQSASVEKAWPKCDGLVAAGLTPLAVFYATKNAYPLAKRLQKFHLSVDSVLFSHPRAGSQSAETTFQLFHYVVRDAVQVSRCSEQAAATLVDWLIKVARKKPYVFQGAQAELTETGVQLIADYTNMPLQERWSKVRTPG